MQFYKLDGIVTNEKWDDEGNDRRAILHRTRNIKGRSFPFNQRLHGKAFLFVNDVSEIEMTVGVLMSAPGDVMKLINEYLRVLGIQMKETFLEEITFFDFRRYLAQADRNDCINDDDEILEMFGLDKIDPHYSRFEHGENLLEELGKKAVYQDANHFPGHHSLAAELDRVYGGKAIKGISGHPVHYMIFTDDYDIRKEMYRLLLSALYANERIRNKRYCYLDFRPGERFSRTVYDFLYKSNIGGTVVVRYQAGDDTEDDRANANRDTIEALCETMKKYRSQVLTVFCLPYECTKAKDIFYEYLDDTSFIELKEEFVTAREAEDCLRKIAKGNGIRTDKNLFKKLEDGKEYLSSDLQRLFDSWYNKKLKKSVYPQYKDIADAKRKTIKAAPKGSAYDELQQMIGLDEAKKVIYQALNYFKAQKVFAEKGMVADHPAMHMVFTGNPGTAKTSVARLFAEIMRENGLLSKGDLIEVGRGDLVGKYVGWTATIVQEKFKKARGSVLFIDEAYSLVDDRGGSFGDEAINTIVQEMENHRDDVVVIFAGYPDKMEEFLDKNPGLRSRIAFHVPFHDYDTESLCRIAGRIAEKKGLTLTEDACEKLSGIFDRAREESDFGNGRYVRNIIEKAKMAQASRLLKMDYDLISIEDIATIRAEDIEIPPVTEKIEKRAIGF